MKLNSVSLNTSKQMTSSSCLSHYHHRLISLLLSWSLVTRKARRLPSGVEGTGLRLSHIMILVPKLKCMTGWSSSIDSSLARSSGIDVTPKRSGSRDTVIRYVLPSSTCVSAPSPCSGPTNSGSMVHVLSFR